jgi:predicted transcriptional regulator
MGRKKLYNILLREGEREELKRNLRKGKSSARSQTRARILLLADEGRDDDEITDILKVSKSTVGSVPLISCSCMIRIRQ